MDKAALTLTFTDTNSNDASTGTWVTAGRYDVTVFACSGAAYDAANCVSASFTIAAGEDVGLPAFFVALRTVKQCAATHAHECPPSIAVRMTAHPP